MHLNIASPYPTFVEIELHIWVVRQQAHANSAVGNSFRNHKRGQSLA